MALPNLAQSLQCYFSNTFHSSQTCLFIDSQSLAVLISLSGEERQVREEVRVSGVNLILCYAAGWSPHPSQVPPRTGATSSLCEILELHTAAAVPELRSQDVTNFPGGPAPHRIATPFSRICKKYVIKLHKFVRNWWVLE